MRYAAADEPYSCYPMAKFNCVLIGKQFTMRDYIILTRIYQCMYIELEGEIKVFQLILH